MGKFYFHVSPLGPSDGSLTLVHCTNFSYVRIAESISLAHLLVHRWIRASFNRSLGVFRESKWWVMENTFEVVRNIVRRDFISRHLLKVHVFVLRNVVEVDTYEVVSVVTILLVKESDRMQNFVQDCSDFDCAAWSLKVDCLIASSSSNMTPASSKIIVEHNEILLGGSWHKLHACVLLE